MMFSNNQEEIIHAVERHALESFPNECCGVVLRLDNGFEYKEMLNLSETPQTSFKIDPVYVAINYARIECVVHSHPNHSPKPSESDIRMSNSLKKPLLIISTPSMSVTGYTPDAIKKSEIGCDFFYALNDCITAVETFYKSEFDIEVKGGVRPKYNWWNGTSNDEQNWLVNGFEARGFYKVDLPMHGDIIIIKFPNIAPSHIGIYIDDGCILHNTIGSASRKEVYGTLLRKFTLCFMRSYERD